MSSSWSFTRQYFLLACIFVGLIVWSAKSWNFTEHLQKDPNAAGFYFHVEFFLTTWDPTNPEEDLMVKRYRKSRVPRWECQKYLYLPSRVKTSITHYFYSVDSKYSWWSSGWGVVAAAKAAGGALGADVFHISRCLRTVCKTR